MTTDHRSFPPRRLATAVAAAATVLLIAAMLMLWGWNTLAVEIFRAPAAEFRHALAAEALLVAVTAVCVMALRLCRQAR